MPAYPRLLAMMYTVTLRQHSIDHVTSHWRHASGSGASIMVRVFAWLVTRCDTVTRDRAGVALRLPVLTEARQASNNDDGPLVLAALTGIRVRPDSEVSDSES
jgi:hypothetical protein